MKAKAVLSSRSGRVVLTWHAHEVWPHIGPDGATWRFGARTQSLHPNLLAALRFARLRGLEVVGRPQKV